MIVYTVISMDINYRYEVVDQTYILVHPDAKEALKFFDRMEDECPNFDNKIFSTDTSALDEATEISRDELVATIKANASN